MTRRLYEAEACVAALALTFAAPAAAASEWGHDYVIAIGYNGVPANGDSSLQPLRFADDDAIAFFAFASATARRAHLLTVVDVASQRRFGADIPPTRPPSVAELRGAVADIRDGLDEDARAGTPSSVYLYYSGHGTAADGHEPALALIDGALTRSMLYDDVLARLPATHIHLFVDACHAEAVVRPRDAEARVVPTSEDDRASYALTTTLARFPRAGAVMAATRNAQAHEWETYLGGVFTHELLSGLRGAADVNGDDRIEYSELAAFLSAANGSVRDPRARLDTVTHAPSADPRAPIVLLDRRTGDATFEIRNVPPGALFIEDDRGNRLADARPENGHGLRLRLPAGRTWYVHTAQGEAQVRPAPGARIVSQSLAFRISPFGTRGALETALHDGLFATPFGPAYYRGFIDGTTDLVPVPLLGAEQPEPSHEFSAAPRVSEPARVWGWATAGGSAALAIGSGVFGWMALQAKADFDNTSIERHAVDASTRYARDTSLAAVLGGGAIAGAAAAAYLLLRPNHDARSRADLGRGLAIDF